MTSSILPWPDTFSHCSDTVEMELRVFLNGPRKYFSKKIKIQGAISHSGKNPDFLFSGFSTHSAQFTKFQPKDFAAQGVRMIM